MINTSEVEKPYSDFYKLAEPYARMGIPCFPLNPNSKLPPAWMTDFPSRASHYLPQLKQWSDKMPNANLGLLGRDNKAGDIAFLEFDQGCIAEAAAEMNQPAPITRIHISGGKGLEHCCFKQTTRSLNLGNRSANKNGKEWFSLRMHARYVLGPGSIHPDTGKVYTVGNDIPPIEFPLWLVEWIEKYTASDRASIGKDIALVDEDFDFESFREWLPFTMTQDGYWYIADACPGVGRRHEQSTKTGLYWDGSRLGWKCFAQLCPCAYRDTGAKFTIGDLISKLSEEHGAYDGIIWPETPIEEELEELNIEEVMPEVVPIRPNGHAPGETVEAPVVITQPRLEVDPLAFPEECLYGRLGELARHLDVPLGLAYPAILGCYSILPEADEMCDTRINLYVPLVAPVGGAKDIVITRSLKSVGVAREDWTNATVVSDRGLMNEVGDRPGDKRSDPRIAGPKKKLLVSKEMSDILRKASIDNSTLFGTFTNFWDENEKAVSDAKGRQEANCRLSWVGGIPIKKNAPEEFAEMFGTDSAKGLLSRCILGYTDRKFTYRRGWKPLYGPPETDSDFTPETAAPVVLSIDPEAEAMWDVWTQPQDEDGRLRYNLLKWALLTASGNRDVVLGMECMRRAIMVMDWQARLRDVFKPGVAENTQAAKFTECALRTFARKGAAFQPVNWKILASTNNWVERFSGYIVNSGIKNLTEVGRLVNVPGPKTGKMGSHVMLNDFTPEGIKRIQERLPKPEATKLTKAQQMAHSIDG